MKSCFATCLLGLTLCAIAASLPVAAFAGEIYGSQNGSPHDDAVPGEYFFYKGVEAVKKEDYRHAVAMYKIAAYWGYKPAEYNLGVVFTKGEGGIPEDHAQGLAWLTLAAERNNTDYVEARDRVKAYLPAEEVARASELLVDLQKSYGDEVAMPRAKARWREARNSATGSHVGFTGSNLQVGGFAPRQNNYHPAQQKATKGTSGETSAADLTGGNYTDGSIAYRELRATDNPYDPKFEAGTVIVEPLTPVDAKNKDKPEPERH